MRGFLVPSDGLVESSKPVQVGDDRLLTMLKLQDTLQHETYGWEFDRLTPDARAAFIRDTVLALTDELHEALNETGWKPWATKRHFNWGKYFGEIIDAWHFMMNMMLASGMTPEEIAETFYGGYLAKMKLNEKRQQEGYDGVSTKCAGCARALDDIGVACWRRGDQGWCEATQSDLNILEVPKN
jgi:hypothetical protein